MTVFPSPRLNSDTVHDDPPPAPTAAVAAANSESIKAPETKPAPPTTVSNLIWSVLSMFIVAIGFVKLRQF